MLSTPLVSNIYYSKGGDATLNNDLSQHQAPANSEIGWDAIEQPEGDSQGMTEASSPISPFSTDHLSRDLALDEEWKGRFPDDEIEGFRNALDTPVIVVTVKGGIRDV